MTTATQRRAKTVPTDPNPRPTPYGTLFFVHGANETSEGLVEHNVSRIEDQVRTRGWDVRVVAPEWRRRSGLRLGNWRKAIYRREKPNRRCRSRRFGPGSGRDGDHEGRHELLRGPARVACSTVLRAADCWPTSSGTTAIATRSRRSCARSSTRAADAGRRPPRPARGAQPRRDRAWSTSWRRGRRRRSRRASRSGSQAPLLYTFDAIPSMPYDEADPPHLRDALAQHLRQPRLPVVPGRAPLPPRRMASPASSTCASARARTSRAHTARTGSSIRCGTRSPTAFTWKRTEPLTVREARALGFEARRRSAS